MDGRSVVVMVVVGGWWLEEVLDEGLHRDKMGRGETASEALAITSSGLGRNRLARWETTPRVGGGKQDGTAQKA